MYAHFHNYKTSHRNGIIMHAACLVFNSVSDVPVYDVL